MLPVLRKTTVAAGLTALLVHSILAQEAEPLPETCTSVASATYPSNPKLPDPFLLADGSRLRTRDEWACKRAEIRSQMEEWELGPKPTPPTVEASTAGDAIDITVTDEGRSISFSVTVRMPSGPGPHPAVIGLGGGSIPVPDEVALISYDNHDIAADYPYGQGKFYDLYGPSHPAGGLMAWAWGASRIVDALEALGDDSGIDATRLAVTGCSRNGKGALVAGAFDDRIALTIPQEGGSGGPGCWRIVNDMKARGMEVEDSTQIVTGDGWFTPSFVETANDVSALPYDHHMLMALVAPRALLVVENSGIEYLGPPSTYGCSAAAREVFEALGAGANIGLAQVSHGLSHCQLPSESGPDVEAFISRFLLGESADTAIWKSDGDFEGVLGDWADWTLDVLEE
ncbi:hypothetical protein VUR80DRAFT_6558 [Thermomyces stellatus]